MTDSRRHRGAAPGDDVLFCDAWLPRLRQAVRDLSYLRGRGYTDDAATKLVGDRYELRRRQRVAVQRCAAGEGALADRGARRVSFDALAGESLAIDGFNCLIVLESALSGAVVLVGTDRAYRDLASVHGTYRPVDETPRAVAVLGELLVQAEVSDACLVLDRPVSNSGRLKAMIENAAAEGGWPLRVELARDADPVLADMNAVVATSDAPLLDRVGRWCDLVGEGVRRCVAGAWVVDLGTSAPGPTPDQNLGDGPKLRMK